MAERTGDSTVIRRTIIERGVRSSDYPGGRASTEAMKNFANQHAEEKREMQERELELRLKSDLKKKRSIKVVHSFLENNVIQYQEIRLLAIIRR